MEAAQKVLAHRGEGQCGVVMTPGAIDGGSCVDSDEHGTHGKSHAHGDGDGDESSMVGGGNDRRRALWRGRHDESTVAAA